VALAFHTNICLGGNILPKAMSLGIQLDLLRVPEVLSAFYCLAGLVWSLWIVGRWLSLFIRHFGGKPKPVAAFNGVTGGRYPPPERCMLYSVIVLSYLISCMADHLLGNSVGAIR
jgi:hypothetical protein